ncbi:MAG: DUF1861 family protein [Sporolactobacillus sp.]
MHMQKGEIKTCIELLKEFEQRDEQPNCAEKLLFENVGGKDVYNITAPFEDEGDLLIAGRVEDRNEEFSEVHFFVQKGGSWVPKKDAPVFQLQDPFVTRIGGDIVLGGVQIKPYPHQDSVRQFVWWTVFYRGTCIHNLKKFADGPLGMKDIRLIELNDGSIGVFTRPQGQIGGRGRIGFARIPSLEALNAKTIEEAPLLDNLFADEEWGGANEVHVLANGLLGILGHVACFDKTGKRHYYPMIFILNPNTRETSNISLVATRSNFLKGPSKRPDLEDIVFSGGLVRQHNGKVTFFAGTSDTEAQKITLKDPFVDYEQEAEI